MIIHYTQAKIIVASTFFLAAFFYIYGTPIILPVSLWIISGATALGYGWVYLLEYKHPARLQAAKQTSVTLGRVLHSIKDAGEQK